MQIRKARSADIEQVTELSLTMQGYHAAFDGVFALTENAREGLASFLGKCVRSRKRLLIVAEEDNRIVGYALATLASRPPIFRQREYGFIEDVFVAEKYRNRGITKRMLDATYSWFRKHGIKEAVLTVHAKNRLGIMVWEREGFETVFLRKRKWI
ncbi:MAG: GNAT family N-acetyltransferase [Candidatus Eisenbacteria bacterium]|nr:GNAT family N-acetyltransferase [Candidatus Eisenbacteria bacterium]